MYLFFLPAVTSGWKLRVQHSCAGDEGAYH